MLAMLNLGVACFLSVKTQKTTSVFLTEVQEKENYNDKSDEALRTRYMFFDMIKWRDTITK